MRKSLVILSTTFFLGFGAFAQSNHDVIYTSEGPKDVKIKEVGEFDIKYTHPNEETVYSMNKYLVKKIKFSSGREEVIEMPFKEINGLENKDDVFITYNPAEVTGLENKGELFSKATGVTVFSSMSNVKNRSLDKIKAEAAMVGANVVLIADAQSRGNYYGNQYTPSQSTQTVLFGQAYSSKELETKEIREKIKNKKVLYYQIHQLNRDDFSPSINQTLRYDQERKPVMNEVTKVEEIDNRLYVEIPGIKTRTGNLEVIRYKDGVLTLMEKHKNSVYNYIFLTEESEYMKRNPKVSGYF